jgi:SAM-dependent methyltransferase
MKRGKTPTGRRRAARRPAPHRHYLYTASVQSVDADVQFLRRIYRQKHGVGFRRLREDFCGTAVLACDWVRRGPENEAWGVDLHRETLEWAREHYVPRLGRAAGRLHLVNGNVLSARTPRVDIVTACNFSYSVFKTRDEMRRYFAAARRALTRGGLFVLDAWGGKDVMGEDVETRRCAAEKAFDGTPVPAFTYVWEQVRFNPVDHAMRCHIHFRLRDGRELKRAFTYDWRLWTLPELRELLAEAGFKATDVYVDGWDEAADEGDGIYRRKGYFENQEGWVAYVVGHA